MTFIKMKIKINKNLSFCYKERPKIIAEISGNHNGSKKKFLDLIVCPVSKEKLQYDKKNNELISKKAKLAYKIKNGIPILLPEEARKI